MRASSELLVWVDLACLGGLSALAVVVLLVERPLADGEDYAMDNFPDALWFVWVAFRKCFANGLHIRPDSFC